MLHSAPESRSAPPKRQQVQLNLNCAQETSFESFPLASLLLKVHIRSGQCQSRRRVWPASAPKSGLEVTRLLLFRFQVVQAKVEAMNFLPLASQLAGCLAEGNDWPVSAASSLPLASDSSRESQICAPKPFTLVARTEPFTHSHELACRHAEAKCCWRIDRPEAVNFALLFARARLPRRPYGGLGIKHTHAQTAASCPVAPSCA